MNMAIDTSVIIAVLVNEPERNRIIQLTADAGLIAPASVHWEVGNAFAAMLKRKRISLDQITVSLTAYEQIPIRFIDVELASAMLIAAEYDLYAYDAYVIQSAIANRCPLISLDRGLLRVAQKLRVRTIEVPI